jgi:hypothetical protein
MLDGQTAMWQGLTGINRTAKNLISGPSLTAKTRLLSFDRIQYRVVTHFCTGRNTLIRLPYIGLTNSPLCRWCGEQEETSAHILCGALASLRHTYFSSFFMNPEVVICLNLRTIRNFSKQGSHDLDIRLQSTKGLSIKPMCITNEKAQTIYYSIMFCSIPLHAVYKLSGCVLRYGELQEDFQATNVCVAYEHNQSISSSTGAKGHLNKYKHF